MTEIYEDFIYKRTYSRWIESKKRREDWEETVDRYSNFFINIVPDDYKDEFIKAINSIKNKNNMPSMRSLYTAGKALERDNIAGYNCCAIEINTLKSFPELLYILMNGTGVGFSVERQVICNLPEIPKSFENVDTNIVFSDSKRGWAEGYYSYIRYLFNGEIPKYDLSKIRPGGSILKTFGGRSSGPVPLDNLLKKTKNTIVNACGRKLNSLECHDICCFIAEAVVVGGVRRSSGISFSNLSDERMRNAKSGEFWITNPQRCLANNSVAYTEKPDIPTFMSEWRSLIKSGTGERGIVNRECLDKTVKNTGRRSTGYNWILNPCFSGDMKLLTKEGYKTFEELCGSTPIIINKNGNESQSKIWCSGEKETVILKFSDKKEITCTPAHVFLLNDNSEIEAKDALRKRPYPFINLKKESSIKKESFIAGFILGDGNLTDLNNKSKRGLAVNIGVNDIDVANYIDIEYKDGCRNYYERRFSDIAIKYNLPSVISTERFIPTDNIPYDSCMSSFLRGVYSANGSILFSNKTLRVTYKTASYRMAITLQDVLEKYFSIKSYITTNGSKVVEFDNGNYKCKESYDLNIGKWSDIKKFAENIGFQQKYKSDKLFNGLVKHSPTIISIKKGGLRKVYDFTEPELHWGVVEGVIVHNCAEIILRPNEFCNLTEVVCRENDTKEELFEKVKNATILGCVQATLTDFKFINIEFKKNCEEERLLGVSLTGLRDCKILNTVSEDTSKLLERLRDYSKEIAEEWSKILGINMPAAITCVKPSGTVSQLVNSSSGLHPRFSKFYIRRVRVTSTDPLCKFLKESGVNNHPEVGDNELNPNTVVFDFPIKSPEGCICNSDVSAIDQLEYWKMLKVHWCEHNPSCTVFVDEEEWLDVGAWVYKNWDIIGGLSFLNKSNNIYQLQPYEEISEELYIELLDKFPKIDFNELNSFEDTDNTFGAKEYACSAGSCELI